MLLAVLRWVQTVARLIKIQYEVEKRPRKELQLLRGRWMLLLKVGWRLTLRR